MKTDKDMKPFRNPERARAARTLAKRRRWAVEMREAGWIVIEPIPDAR